MRRRWISPLPLHEGLDHQMLALTVEMLQITTWEHNLFEWTKKFFGMHRFLLWYSALFHYISAAVIVVAVVAAHNEDSY